MPTDEVRQLDPDDETEPRRLPVTLSAVVVALVLIGAAATFSSGLRHQIAGSVGRQRAPFVELFFSGSSAGLAPGCARNGTRPAARFVIVGHLGEDRRLEYRVRLEPRQGGVRTLTGTAAVRKDGALDVVRTAASPLPGAYDIRVQLPALDQQVEASCSGATG